MYKKFLSAILFGSFMVTATGTFVSCKDYDDDIDNLQGQINEIATSLGDLKSKVGSFVKSVTYDSAKGILTVVDNNGSSVSYTIAPNLPTYSLTVGADGTISLLKDNAVISTGKIVLPAAFDASKFTVDASGKVSYNGTATSLVIPKTESFDPSKLTFDAATGKILYNGTPTSIVLPTVESFDPSKLVVDPQSGKVLYNGTATTVVIPSDGVITLKDSKDANGATVGYSINYKGQSVSFGLNDILTLKSLVFKSDLFVNGIEAIEYPYMQYIYHKEGSSSTVTTTDENDVTCTVITPSKEWVYDVVDDDHLEYNPIEMINYHLNPSSAKVAKENLSFISRDVESISRASVANPTVESLSSSADGVITVGFRAIGSEIANGNRDRGEYKMRPEEGNSTANIMALQAVVKSGDKDTTVTSDYAMLYASTVKPRAIAFSNETYKSHDCPASTDELCMDILEAIEDAPSAQVAYDGSIDLKEIIGTHYDWSSKTKNGGHHKLWKFGEEAKFGLKYDFALMQYKTGDNETSDSKYAVLENGVLTPRIVDASGATMSQQGISSVGKRPIVRVRLLDSQNRVVLYAFVKLVIVKKIGSITTDPFTFTQAFSCDNIGLSLTWSQISYQLLEKAAVQSKDEFDALYMFDAQDHIGNQFVKNGLEYASAPGNKVLGKVSEKRDDTGTTNSVLVWDLSAQDQQKIYEMPDHTATIYVRYVSRQSTTANIPIYMPLTVTITKPVGAVVTKLSNYWFDNQSKTLLNVQYPKDLGNTSNYTVDLNQVWEGNAPKFGLPVSGYKYYFIAKQNVLKVGGNTYTLSVNSLKANDMWTGSSYDVTVDNALAHALKSDAGVYTNNALYASKNGAAKELIATIDQTNSTITYANNALAKEMLNSVNSIDEPYKNFANIGICAYRGCDIAYPLNNAEYPACFLRPINPVGNDKGEFVDAEANGSVINVAEIFDFTDWRGIQFVNGDNFSNSWLYAFYGLNKVTLNIAGVTTDLSGGTLGQTTLSSKTNKIILTQLDGNYAPQTNGLSFNLDRFNYEMAGNEANFNSIIKAMGMIKYENNGNNVQSFKLQIPVVFSYTWGDISTFAIVNVKGTGSGQN